MPSLETAFLPESNDFRSAPVPLRREEVFDAVQWRNPLGGS